MISNNCHFIFPFSVFHCVDAVLAVFLLVSLKSINKERQFFSKAVVLFSFSKLVLLMSPLLVSGSNLVFKCRFIIPRTWLFFSRKIGKEQKRRGGRDKMKCLAWLITATWITGIIFIQKRQTRI